MTPWSLRAAMIPVALFVVGGCEKAAYSNEEFLLESPLPVVEGNASAYGTQFELREALRLGTPAGVLAFRSIGAAALSTSGLVAIADPQACSVTLIDRRSEQMIRRIQGCEAGTRDLSGVTAMGFEGDSLLVVDRNTRTLEVREPSGGLIRTVRLGLPPRVHVASMASAGHPNYWVSLEGEWPMFEDRNFVGVLNVDDGSVSRTSVSDVPYASRYISRRMFRKPSCFFHDDSEWVIVTMNDWLFQGMGTGSTGRVRFNFLTSNGFQPARDNTDSPFPVTPVWVACAGTFLLFKATVPQSRTRLFRRGSPYVTLLEVRSRSGVLLARWVEGDPLSPLHGRLLGTVGDTVFVATNVAGYPQMVAVTLEER